VSDSHITRYDKMPIPPVAEQTEYFEAGPITFGVEYRLLTDAIAAASAGEDARGVDSAAETGFDDRGVAIHVFGEDPDGSEGRAQGAGKAGRVGGEGSAQLEYLRFDCFNEDPHYHYISWKQRSNEMLHLDPVADGDPLLWALERIRTRLPQMLERAGARELAARVDPRLVEQVLARVSEAAWRSRYHHDDEAVLRDALKRKAR
jgi:hypothetical protein